MFFSLTFYFLKCKKKTIQTKRAQSSYCVGEKCKWVGWEIKIDERFSVLSPVCSTFLTSTFFRTKYIASVHANTLVENFIYAFTGARCCNHKVYLYCLTCGFPGLGEQV